MSILSSTHTKIAAVVLAAAALPSLRSLGEQEERIAEASLHAAINQPNLGGSPLFPPVILDGPRQTEVYHHDTELMERTAERNDRVYERYQVAEAARSTLNPDSAWGSAGASCDSEPTRRVTPVAESSRGAHDFIATHAQLSGNSLAPSFPASPSHPALALGERSDQVASEMDADMKTALEDATKMTQVGKDAFKVAAAAVATVYGGPAAGAAVASAVDAIPNPAELGVPGSRKERSAESDAAVSAIVSAGEKAAEAAKEKKAAEEAKAAKAAEEAKAEVEK